MLTPWAVRLLAHLSPQVGRCLFEPSLGLRVGTVYDRGLSAGFGLVHKLVRKHILARSMPAYLFLYLKLSPANLCHISYLIPYFKLHSTNNVVYSSTSPILHYLLGTVLS
jgi:hypothetical protein